MSFINFIPQSEYKKERKLTNKTNEILKNMKINEANETGNKSNSTATPWFLKTGKERVKPAKWFILKSQNCIHRI